jgi:hypothetical protein
MSDGFPADTPVSAMTTEQQVLYWKHQSRKHESRLRDRWDDPEKLRSRLAELDPAARSAAPAEPEYVSPDPPEAEAENEAWAAAQAERTALRRSALLGEFIAATGHKAEFFDVYLPHVLVDKFFNDDGTVDRDAVKDAARHFKPASQPPQPNQTWNGRDNDPIAAAMARIGNADDIDTQVGQAVKRLGG